MNDMRYRTGKFNCARCYDINCTEFKHFNCFIDVSAVFKKILLLIIACSLIILLVACAPTQPRIEYVTEYKDVYIPTQCDAEIPTKPPPADSLPQMINDLILYAKQLHAGLLYCTQKETKK